MSRRYLDRGEVWRLRKGHVVVVLSRRSVLKALHTATVAAIGPSRPRSPIEVPLSTDEGLEPGQSANLAHVFSVRQTDFAHYVGALGPEKMLAVSRALMLSCGCDS